MCCSRIDSPFVQEIRDQTAIFVMRKRLFCIQSDALFPIKTTEGDFHFHSSNGFASAVSASGLTINTDHLL